MARKLKTYLTTSGFFETAVAAPSMKAALDIWGNKTNLFQQGFAKETDDPEIVKAAMAHPGVVLRRPVGSKGVFKQDAELPKLAALEKASPPKPKAAPAKKQKAPAKEKARRKSEPNTAHRKAAELYDLAQKRREKEEQREQEKRERERERRKQAVDKAKAALDAAREHHEERLAEIESEREKIDRKIRLERERWDDEKDKLEAAIKRAGD